MVNFKVVNKINPPEIENLRFGGKIAEQAELFFHERVTSDYARDTILNECAERFELRADDINAVGWWSGEFWGKWAISGCRVARYEHDEKLKETLHNTALRLMATADEDGYIGSYRDKKNFFPANTDLTFPIMGWKCDFNWNLWCRKYTLWGLIEIYQLTKDEEILTATAKSALQFISMLEEMNVRPSETGVLNGLPTCSILKPMLILYRITENKRFLDFALEIADDWEREDGRVPNLISNALSMKPVHEWYPNPHLWAKAYEMMSCLDGLIELYRVTGVEKYLRTVENIYTLLCKHELNAIFSVGFNDKFTHAGIYPNAISEPCDVIHWIRVCSELYKVTGEIKYIDSIERAFYNPFLAGVMSDGKWGARAVRCLGRHMMAGAQAKTKYSHCCVNNIPRGFINAAETFVSADENSIYVNLYSEFESEINDSEVRISGDYLGNGIVDVEINSSADSTVKFRIPEWSKTTEINGKTYTCPQSYVNFELKSGLNKFEIHFDMTATIHDFPYEVETFPANDHRVFNFVSENPVPTELMIKSKQSTIVRGALLLTRSKLVGNTEAEMFASDSIWGKNLTCEVEPIESDSVRNAFKVKFVGEGGFETYMCDYASGSNIWSKDDDKLFNIWM